LPFISFKKAFPILLGFLDTPAIAYFFDEKKRSIASLLLVFIQISLIILNRRRCGGIGIKLFDFNISIGKEKPYSYNKEQHQKAGAVSSEPRDSRTALILNESGADKTTGSRQKKAEKGRCRGKGTNGTIPNQIGIRRSS